MALRVTEIRMLIKSLGYHLDPISHQTWNTPTITDWLQKKGLYLSDAETSTACQLVTPAKSWSICLTVKHHITRNYIKDLTSSWSPQRKLDHCLTFSGYIIAAVWWANSGHSIVSPEINSCNGYILDQEQSIKQYIFCQKGHPPMNQYSKYSMDVSYSLLFTSTDKHFNSLLKFNSEPFTTSIPLISSHILVDEWMQHNQRGSSSLGHFLCSNQDDRSGRVMTVQTYTKNSALIIPRYVSFFSPRTTTGQATPQGNMANQKNSNNLAIWILIELAWS